MSTVSRALSAGKSSGAPNLLARCMELVEERAHAALLLMRILFWLPKSSLRHSGHAFIVKLRQDWAAEAGISFDQCKRAIAVLRRLGLAAAEQHKFGGRNISHVRLMGPGRAAHARCAGWINVLHVRPTEQVWHAGTTFRALDAALGG